MICYGTIGTDTCYHGIDEFVYLNDIKNTRDLIVNIGKEPKEKIA